MEKFNWNQQLQGFKEKWKNFSQILENLDFSENLDLHYQTEVSALYSSKIEGNSHDLNSFINQKNIQEKFRTKDTQEILDLVVAYEFAQKKSLTEENFLHAHKLASTTILPQFYSGKYRDQPVGIYGKSGLIYLAIEAEKLETEMQNFWKKIADLREQDLAEVEVLYYASMIHLRFAHIHPFMDGNGRSARLLEKWFLSQKLGKKYWNISTEKYYWDFRPDYYKNINLGVNFYELDYKKSLNFLDMLPQSIKHFTLDEL